MNQNKLPEILVISSYPPRECGIANYSVDLISALSQKFNNSFKLSVCALESESEKHRYTNDVRYILDASDETSYGNLTCSVNKDNMTKLVFIQHEFGLFYKREASLLRLITSLNVPVMITFHTVLPDPDEQLKLHIRQLAAAVVGITVMTNNAAQILQNDYGITREKITVVPHGTHLVQSLDKQLLKQKYGFKGRQILSTFGLISCGKSIETTLDALSAVIAENPNVLFLIIGKTHPTVILSEGEQYRSALEEKVIKLKLQKHVTFLNQYLPLNELLEYLQLTDIYLFTSNNPHQAVSGTFSYAIGSGCPVISTPIPHALEVLNNDAGILIDFGNSKQLSEKIILLLNNKQLRDNFTNNGLHRIAPTAWENVAVAHAGLFQEFSHSKFSIKYSLPTVNLNHIKKMTTDFGIIQFSTLNHPDQNSGYTLDDNARAMIAMCMRYSLTKHPQDLDLIRIYLEFIQFCLQHNGQFLNYVNHQKEFTEQNNRINLDDSNGRAIWALGYLVSLKEVLPPSYVSKSAELFKKAMAYAEGIHSSRSIAFVLKGLFYYNKQLPSLDNIGLAERLAGRLERMYTHESELNWNWFEGYLTYGNSILPEGMLCAYLITGNQSYKTIAKMSFDFLLKNTFTPAGIKLISNRSWMKKGETADLYGEQPIDVAYTVLALCRFLDIFEDETYLDKIELAFSWFLGNNHLHQIIYNPCTGGCYDGLEETHVNLNQGAESTVSYLMARLSVEKYTNLSYQVNTEVSQQSAGIY